jgi:hypothetical protein
VQLAAGQRLACPDVEELQLVGAVRDENDARRYDIAVERHARAVRVPQRAHERPRPGECVASPTMVLPPVDE